MDKRPTWVVAYDFSDTAELALRTAVTLLARQGGGKLVLAHAHPHGSDPDGVGVDLRAVGPGAGAELDQAHFTQATRRLGAIADAVAVPDVEVSVEVRWGPPAETLVTIAEQLHSEVLVVGSHGRRGFQRLILGSVAEHIVRHARGSVLLVKPPH